MEAAHQAAEAGVQSIQREEAALRRAIAELQEKCLAARTLPGEQLAAPRAIGADLLWQGWTQRKRRELNMELARVLVRKAEKMDALRRSFGRAEACRHLIREDETARRKAAQGREAESIQLLAVMSRATSTGERNP